MPDKPGYENLITFQNSVEIYDLTLVFTDRFLSGRDFFVQENKSFRQPGSAKQCIVEGYFQKSTKDYIKHLGVTRGPFEELLEDYKDFA